MPHSVVEKIILSEKVHEPTAVKATAGNNLNISELIMLANYEMLVGNFDMDLSDGEIRFKTSVCFGQLEWSDELIKVSVYTSIFSMNQYSHSPSSGIQSTF